MDLHQIQDILLCSGQDILKKELLDKPYKTYAERKQTECLLKNIEYPIQENAIEKISELLDNCETNISAKVRRAQHL